MSTKTPDGHLRQQESRELSLRTFTVTVADWISDGELRQLSKSSLTNRRVMLGLFRDYLVKRGAEVITRREIRGFLSTLTSKKPSTSRTYYKMIAAFFRFCVEEELIDTSPMEGLKSPISRPDQVIPLTPEQFRLLLGAAARTPFPRRNTAILWFLVDTGCRATEMCNIRMRDVSLDERRVTITGKGNKKRSIYYGRETARALRAYLREESREDDDPLFSSDPRRGMIPLTRSGLYQMVERSGEEAGITGVRCSPHTLRHTFAVEYLRAGGNVFALKELLGHTTLSITSRYVALAQADLETAHRQFSPGDRMGKKKE